MKQICTLLLAFVLCSTTTYSTTWNEPWQDKVIMDADYFVFAKVVSFNENSGVTIDIIKCLGGQELKGIINVTGFYLLDLCSMSGGHGAGFQFDDIKECYFFIKRNNKGSYCIATPTSGFDALKDGYVHATYRHSYHQALVPVDMYEKTMAAIFNNYHNRPYDAQIIAGYVNNYLSVKPAGFADSEIDNFFGQHVALECIYHLRLNEFYSKILPFLADTSNLHNQVSAARALVSYNTTECKRELMKVITDTTRSHFVQVICIWTLSDFKPAELKGLLMKASKTASTKENGFGGNIMDPRICTHFPNVKDALKNLIKTL